MNCIKIKRIIDEADRPDVFPLEAAGHLAGCPDCQNFADERAKLRELTGSVGRVSAPTNFNVLLSERLSQVKSQKSFWLNPAGFLRVATAAAGVLVVFVTLQYGGFLSTKRPAAVDQPADVLAGGSKDSEAREATPVPAPPATGLAAPGVGLAAPGVGLATNVVSAAQDDEVKHRLNAGPSRPRTNPVSTSRTARATGQDGPPLLLVRDSNGDRTLQMIPVSLGMQQQIQNASAGRQQLRSSDISY